MSPAPRQHTPGPWTIHPHRDDADSCEIHDTIGSFASCIPANARLIAAAPTMFDYLALLASRGNDEAHEIIKKITGP